MSISEARLCEIEKYYGSEATAELIATIRELQQSVSVPSEPLVSREEAAKIVAERGKELRRMANAPMLDNGAVTRLKGQAAICNELANTIRELPAVSIPVPDIKAAIIQRIKDLRTVWETAARQRGSAFSDRAITATQIIAELEGALDLSAPSPSEED